jgi:hypothetical protein
LKHKTYRACARPTCALDFARRQRDLPGRDEHLDHAALNIVNLEEGERLLAQG